MTPEQFEQSVSKLIDKFENVSLKEPLQKTARRVGKAIEGNFQREEGLDGIPWDPHNPTTIASTGPHPLLRLTYDLFHAATDPFSGGAEAQSEDREIIFGISNGSVPYAKYVQDKRQFFYLRESDAETIADEFMDDAGPVIQREVFE